jgi:hypothetical protein
MAITLLPPQRARLPTSDPLAGPQFCTERVGVSWPCCGAKPTM